MAKRSKGPATKKPTKSGNKKPTKLKDRALGPAADEFGKELAALGKDAGQAFALVGSRLAGMVRGLVYGGDLVWEWLKDAAAERLKDVPPEKIVEPNPRVAVPAAQALTYSLGDEVIREMFANLLAADMNVDTKPAAHPAFVELIKGMTPLEARILVVLRRRAQVEFERRLQKGDRSRLVDTKLSFDIAGASQQAIAEGIGNLIRLGLIERRRDSFPAIAEFSKQYDEMLAEFGRQLAGWRKSQATVALMKIEEGASAKIQRSGLHLTTLGTAFVRICIEASVAGNCRAFR